MEQETVPSPLLAWPGAIASAGGIVAEHYGAPLPEGRGLETGLAFVDLSDHGVVTVTGPDRLSWLHSLSTQALDRLPVGASARTLFLDLRGRIEFDARVVDDGERTFLLLEPGYASGLAAWLDSMRFMLRVEVADAGGEWAVLGSTADWDRADLPGVRWIDPWPQVQVGGFAYGTEAEHPGSEVGWRLDVIPRASLEETATRLRDEVGWRPAGLLAAEQRRIAAWEPSQAHEVDDRTIPHELDLLRGAVHLAKGCYKGQETVARVHNLGHPPRRLVFLDLDGMEHTVPNAGADVLSEDRVVGHVTSAVLHHEAGPIALALIKRAVDPAALLTVRDGDTTYTAAQTVIVPPEAGSVVGRPSGIRRL